MSGFDMFAEIERKTYDWKLAHDQLTFADIELGAEFYDEDGNVWEKRSERRAISWIQGERPEFCDFQPTDRVRIK